MGLEHCVVWHWELPTFHVIKFTALSLLNLGHGGTLDIGLRTS